MVLLLLIIGVIAGPTLSAQSWQPAAQIDGAVLNINIITLPDGTTLIPLMRMKPNQEDSNTLYSVLSLLTDRTPWPKQFKGLPRILGVYDGNGNGHPEVEISPHSDLPQLIFDAFSPFERAEQIPRESGWWPIPREMVEYRGDIDSDQLEDQWVAVKNYQYATVTYGNSPNPYTHRSIVPANYQRANEWRARILAVGPLSGKMCMVQLAFKAEDYNWGFYQLLELNADDLRARRDTIRTTLLNEVANPGKYMFASKILKADTVWHFFPGGLSADVPSLKVTLQRSIIQSTNSVIRESDYSFWFGQGKLYGEWNYPVTMSAHRLIAGEAAVSRGGEKTVIRLYRCSDTDNAMLIPYADAQLPIHADTNRARAVGSCVMIPDQDRDGIEDVIVEHYWTDPGTSTPRSAVSIFLTSQIEPVSVSDAELNLETLDTTTVLTGRRVDNAWVVASASGCVRRDLSPVYNLQGQKIAMIRTEVNGDDVLLLDNGAITERPAWCVIGECVVRLN
jgi:hypothetical protein